MVWLYCLVSFCAGALVCYLLSLLYIGIILKKEFVTYSREMKQSVKLWYLKPFPIIEVLQIHKDNYRDKADMLDLTLQKISRKLDKTAEMLKINQNRLETLERENYRLKSQIKNPGHSLKNQSTDLSSITGKKLNTDHRKNEAAAIYFSIPETDGSFYMEKGDPVQDERKFFSILPAVGTDRGELHFISGTFDQKAIENIDYYLFPVCEVENISQRNSASKVIQIEPGSVISLSGRWMVDKKVMVKLL